MQISRLASSLLLGLAGCDGPAYFSTTATAPSAPAPVTAISIVVSPGELPIGGGTATLNVETRSGTSAVAPRVTVSLQATHGTLETASVTTDHTGHAKVTWEGTRTSVVTATAGDAQATTSIRVLEPAPPLPPSPQPPAPPAPPPTDPLPPSQPQPGPIERIDPNLILTINATPASPIATQEARLSATLTTVDGSTAPTITRYLWDVDGNTVADRTEAQPRVVYPTAGPQLVVLEITAGVALARAQVTLTIAPPPLTVSLAAPPENVAVGTPLMFTATANLAPGETVNNYQWNFLPATGFEATTTTNTRPFTYPTHGIYAATVTITTSMGRTATSPPLSITVTN